MKDDAQGTKGLWPLLGGIAVVSFGLVAFEIGVSRLLSVLLSYHYVFLVLSVALMGLGLGGIWVHHRGSRDPRDWEAYATLARVSTLLACSMPMVVLLACWAGHLGEGPLLLLVHGVILLVPFFLAGVLFAQIYRSFPALSSRTYGVDLVGAGVGAVGGILSLDALGGIGAPMVLGALVSAGALAFALGAGPGGRGGVFEALGGMVLTVGLLLLHVSGAYSPGVPLGRHPSKEIHDALFTFRGKIVETRWSAFGRTDLVAFDEHPDQMDIYLDGTAGSPMYRFSGDAHDPGPAVANLKAEFPGYLPLLHLKEGEKDNALIIGPGGGRDVLLALMAGVRRIAAVEINGDLVDMVRRQSAFAGGIYNDHPHVQVVVDEGRGFLRRQKERYDVIFLSLPVTNTSRSLEGFALTENFLFTKESILEYLDRLTDEGRLVVVGHNDAEALRLLATSVVALQGRGMGDQTAMTHMGLLGSEEYPVFVLKRQSFGPEESLELFASLKARGHPALSSYLPRMGRGGLNPALVALETGQMGLHQLVEEVAQRGFDVQPVSDDSPFFYKIETGIPRAVSLTLWSSLLILGIVIGRLALRSRARASRDRRATAQRGPPSAGLRRFVVLFSMLGMGFMIIEVSLAQRFSLFLGQPAVSLAVVLASLLVGGGLGSLWSGRLGEDELRRGVAFASGCVAALVLCHAFLVPAFLRHLLGLGLAERLTISALLLVPVGFALGIPFPLGIRRLKGIDLEGHIPWMWCINGVSSVVGSAAAIILAIQWSFSAALLIAAGCYVLVTLIFLRS